MGDKGDMSKKQPQQLQINQHTQQLQIPSSSPNDQPDQDSSETRPHLLQDSSSPALSNPPFLYVPAPVPSCATPPFEQHFEAVNPKRTRYTTGQWKLLPSPSAQPKQTQIGIPTGESTPSPTAQTATNAANPPIQSAIAGASSSDTASSPSHSPIPSAISGQETSKPDEIQTVLHHQFRKGKYVSPVWKPSEMLWLARAWKVQYKGSSSGSGSSPRGKTRADKDREVAEFLQKNGVNRDFKTAGTKWDNMLGEFRKVFEWERGGEREKIGKSYFRLSPYERKLHRLPASFDEEVFEELSQFMGSRMRSSQSRASSAIVAVDDGRVGGVGASRCVLPPFKDDDMPFSVRTRQLVVSSNTRGASSRGLESALDINITGASSSSSSRELRRIGKIRMGWEESVSLWGEEGEQHRGRIRLHGLSFLNSDELTFFDEGMVACTMEAFEDGPLKGFSIDRFVSGQQIKVFGRRKSTSASEKLQVSGVDSSVRSVPLPPGEYHDPTEYYLGCLRVSPPSLPSLFELSWHLQEPPPEELRFPLRRDVYRDLPQGKELFFTTTTELLDCRAITYDILSSICRTNPSISSATSSSRDSYIGLWDDCINRVVSKFSSLEMVLIRKPHSSIAESLQDQWPNVTGFVKNFCLWRGEETDELRDGKLDPSNSIVEKLLWTYMDLPYLLGYYAVGYLVTFCALSRTQDRVIRTDLYSLDLSTPSDRLKAMVPCYRIAGLLPLLAERCATVAAANGCLKMPIFSDFERIDLGGGSIMEVSPNTVTRIFCSRRKWAALKDIYDFLNHRIPHAEFIFRSSEKELSLVFQPRGCKIKPANCDQLIEALKFITKALIVLHDLSFMHRDIKWEKVMRRSDKEEEWFLAGFDKAVGAPQIYPFEDTAACGSHEKHAPEMERGLHGVKVDVWGVGYLVKTSGLAGILPKMLKDLQNRCLDQNPDQRPTAADCYHHLLQIQSSLSGVLM